ncbi:MAG: ABC transporter ATP-binding protein [Minisyncoccales bacterium]
MIECKNITKTYKTGTIETQVLKGLSFKINDGEFVAIIGPSGSGKSTLMHIIGMLDTPTSGQYLLNGRDVSKLSDDQLAEIRKSKIGFVFQSFNLLPRTTVLRNVCLPLVYAGVEKSQREKRAKESLAKAGLPEEYYTHYSNQLSGGQMQRVAIARALVNDPSIIFADEPTGNLDTKTGEIVLDTFGKLNEDHNHTIILITHEREVAEYAHRIITVRDGLIVDDSLNNNRRTSMDADNSRPAKSKL